MLAATGIRLLAALWLPDCSVVGEDNSSGVEGVETLDPVGYWREIISVTVLDGARSKEVAAESCRRVMALASDDHRPVSPAHDDRLVARGVARCRHDEHVVQNLRLAVQELVTEPAQHRRVRGGCSRRSSLPRARLAG